MAVLTNPSVAHTENGGEDCPVAPVKTVVILKLGVSNHMILNTNPTRGLLR